MRSIWVKYLFLWFRVFPILCTDSSVRSFTVSDLGSLYQPHTLEMVIHGLRLRGLESVWWITGPGEPVNWKDSKIKKWTFCPCHRCRSPSTVSRILWKTTRTRNTIRRVLSRRVVTKEKVYDGVSSKSTWNGGMKTKF